MKYCAQFFREKEGFYPAPLISKDSGRFVAASLDTRGQGKLVELREIGPVGIGMYTDNHRQLQIRLGDPALSVDLHTWMGAEVDFTDAMGGTITSVTLPLYNSNAVIGTTVVAPPDQPFFGLTITAVGEFMLMEMCVEFVDA